jgi:hypothetical protein
MNHSQQRISDIHDNPHLLVFYANGKCKDCYGRGTRTHSAPNGAGQWVEQKSICFCVRKAVEKESRELWKD